MKRCSSCGQILAQNIKTCPACGSTQAAGMTAIDDYTIQAIIHEGKSSLVCRALKKGQKKAVTIRLFTDQSGVDEKIAGRLEKELETLAKLPEETFVQHYAIRQSRLGYWYRVSEWVDAENWGSIFLSGLLNDQRRMVTLFYNIASALDRLHTLDHFMPYLILDDILLPRNRTGSLAVKINYKLSRFLNARATHHGPMLKKLLDTHPDIVNERAIDFRSGIWSLGKIFVELLTANHNLTRFSSRVDEIEGLTPDLAVLMKIMLSDDPDLRPQSMAKVVDSLGRILENLGPSPINRTKAESAKKPVKIKKARTSARFRTAVILLLVIILGIAGANTYIRIFSAPDPGENGFAQIIESHSQAVGFLMVEYWISHKKQKIYRNKVEGTAFLVDEQGYMLTNRHVACPWLEDATLFRIKESLKDKELNFGHRMFLWFEGSKAFNRFPGFDRSTDLADIYYLADAYKSGGKSNLRVVGVPRGERHTGQGFHQPFHNDFAVLKIDTPPRGVTPLPLAHRQAPEEIKRLSPVIIMGFPLGSRTQDEQINASITRGHVRRTTKALIQVDSSIYKGNSGGPAVDSEGRVIGIASGVVTDRPMERIPLQTPLSDFGLVLPISEPARFVKSLKTGLPKWDGSLDFALEKKLNQVVDLAAAQDYEGAVLLARSLLSTSRDPAFLFTAALLEFCTHNLEAARKGFTRLISIENENMISRLMLLIIDRLTGQNKVRELTRPLFSMPWDHSDEFIGYLAGMLESETPADPEVDGYENRYEQSWINLIQGLILEMRNRPEKAMAAYKKVALQSGANDHLYFMACSRLKRFLNKPAASAEDQSADEYSQKRLWETAAENRIEAKEKYAEAVALISRVESMDSPRPDKAAAYDDLLKIAPANRTILGRAAFFYAQASEWKKTVSFVDRYFSSPVRETPLGLSLGLLKGQSLKLMGPPERARTWMDGFRAKIKNPWYRLVIGQLTGTSDQKNLIKLAAKSPSRLVVLHTALGLDAESEKDSREAARHYREALGTYMDAWNEYDLARARLLNLRSAAN